MKIYQIELTNICNLKCSFCPNRYGWTKRPYGFFNVNLLKDLDLGNTEYVELQLSGESMIHPRVNDAVKILHDRGVLVGISSNGTIDGDYEQFDIVTTTKDIERKFNISGVNVYRQELGVDYDYEDYSHKEIIKDNTSPKICVTPLSFVSIQWNGDVVPCCKCHGSQHVFGNIAQEPLSKIFASEDAVHFRKNMATNYICQYCKSPNPHDIHQKLLTWLENKRSSTSR